MVVTFNHAPNSEIIWVMENRKGPWGEFCINFFSFNVMILIPNKCRFIGINISTEVPSFHLLYMILLGKVRRFCL